MEKITFTKTGVDADGFGVWETPALNAQGARLTVWRRERGTWSWQVTFANGDELPADYHCDSLATAQHRARAWWQQRGAEPIIGYRVMHLGAFARFLANTSERTRTPRATA